MNQILNKFDMYQLNNDHLLIPLANGLIVFSLLFYFYYFFFLKILRRLFLYCVWKEKMVEKNSSECKQRRKKGERERLQYNSQQKTSSKLLQPEYC